MNIKVEELFVFKDWVFFSVNDGESTHYFELKRKNAILKNRMQESYYDEQRLVFDFEVLTKLKNLALFREDYYKRIKEEYEKIIHLNEGNNE